MRLSKKFEQGIYVVFMLALQLEGRPIKSHILSEKLQVSDSYLKKILAKLVKFNIVKSNASKIGGFQLAKNIEELSLYDIYQALEEEKEYRPPQDLAYKIFVCKELIDKNIKKIDGVFSNAFNAFNTELKKLKFSDLIEKDIIKNGKLDWEKI
ncbi:MAG: RrF2 family transcriptional regulator [Streptobacillus sp.]